MQKIKELYFSLKGRISRKSFVLGALGIFFGYVLVFSFALIIEVKAQNLQSQNSPEIVILGILILVLSIMILVANINLHIKRFHDIDMSGWWTLATFLPYIGLLVSLIVAFIPGTQGKNRFGDNPVEMPLKEEDKELIVNNKENDTTKNADIPQEPQVDLPLLYDANEIEKLAIILEKHGEVEVVCNGEKVLCKNLDEVEEVLEARVIDLEDLNRDKEAQYKKAISFEEWKKSQNKEVKNV